MTTERLHLYFYESSYTGNLNSRLKLLVLNNSAFEDEKDNPKDKKELNIFRILAFSAFAFVGGVGVVYFIYKFKYGNSNPNPRTVNNVHEVSNDFHSGLLDLGTAIICIGAVVFLGLHYKEYRQKIINFRNKLKKVKPQKAPGQPQIPTKKTPGCPAWLDDLPSLTTLQKAILYGYGAFCTGVVVIQNYANGCITEIVVPAIATVLKALPKYLFLP